MRARGRTNHKTDSRAKCSSPKGFLTGISQFSYVRAAANLRRYTSGVPQGEYLQYGGQAVPEGVMMRSPHYFAVAVRAPNGQIVVDSDPLEKSWIGRQKWSRLPFVRGAFGIIDAMALGAKAMRFAANVGLDPKYQPDGGEESAAEPAQVVRSSEKANKILIGGALVGGLAIGFFLFNYLPNLLATQFRLENRYLVNFLTEVIKIVFFLGYLILIAQWGEIKRLFQYHGAEHKAINVIENNQELTLENVQAQTRLHPRCGTSFAIVVLLISLFLFTLVPKPIDSSFATSLVRVLIEIPFIAPLAGVSYELIRWAGKMRNSAFVNLLFAPGLATQLITTKEPTDDMVEVAMVSLQTVLDLEAERARRAADQDVSEPMVDQPAHSST